MGNCFNTKSCQFCTSQKFISFKVNKDPYNSLESKWRFLKPQVLEKGIQNNTISQVLLYKYFGSIPVLINILAINIKMNSFLICEGCFSHQIKLKNIVGLGYATACSICNISLEESEVEHVHIPYDRITLIKEKVSLVQGYINIVNNYDVDFRRLRTEIRLQSRNYYDSIFKTPNINYWACKSHFDQDKLNLIIGKCIYEFPHVLLIMITDYLVNFRQLEFSYCYACHGQVCGNCELVLIEIYHKRNGIVGFLTLEHNGTPGFFGEDVVKRRNYFINDSSPISRSINFNDKNCLLPVFCQECSLGYFQDEGAIAYQYVPAYISCLNI